MAVTQVFDAVVLVFETLGVVALCVGLVLSGVLAVRSLRRREGGTAAFQVLRTAFGGTLLLGLEIFVAADIIRTIFTPSLEEAAILGLIVIIRTVLSMSIQIEIDGVLPWRRALLSSGGQVLAREVARTRGRVSEEDEATPAANG